MRSLLRNKKGDSMIFLVAVISVVMIGLMYIPLREGLDNVMDTLNSTSYTFNGSDHENQVWKTYDMFVWFPVIILFVILLWAIVWMKNRRTEYAV